jgi:hypothetical protein
MSVKAWYFLLEVRSTYAMSARPSLGVEFLSGVRVQKVYHLDHTYCFVVVDMTLQFSDPEVSVGSSRDPMP